ncbi:MAG: 30S ribosomal protein S7 [Candidatus Harrisonbacteria bacterium RIFCSPLOWO2_02_FULL_41_13b]|uniref:Small ribosomal subunit protein uS7 n=1 Tax=Candidatus Harrisonbacteria bacterium RIFCSPLOWO2_02_FULL_41_13b TaxID=1798409 RepID=A0A1G1ZPR9_9BACT|nr:MAG: 30S ribosomal protein S7 [Candidatus Harrisonbacteria bacterium RIFCSPHIGHO2_02_FULL_40_20]OGY66693.1 MAG: 30S ribosomal protein S7 [Candidatus Harrisonbacteria bacterium RIFCSPLOWO2_02_FULL_41_13b]
MRRKRNYKRERKPDLKYRNVSIGRLINYLMESGKKTTAERIIYDAFEIISKVSKQDPAMIFEKALANASPTVEVVSRRIGGANYQVPREVRTGRKFMLAANWIITAARSKKGKPMAEKLAEELLAASNNEGTAIKKKQDTHRMAEANRAFAHFAW